MPDTIPGSADAAVGDAGETAPVGDPAPSPEDLAAALTLVQARALI